MVAALLYIPPRGFWAEIDTEEKRDGGNEGRTKFKSPRDIPHVVQRQIGAQTEEDTEGDPHLPAHHETTSNRSRDVFGGKNGDRGCFGPHTNPEQQTADEKLLPGLAESGTDDREKTEDGAEEYSTTTSEVEVERIGKPATTVEGISTKVPMGDDA
jgi:hypothetical protein